MRGLNFLIALASFGNMIAVIIGLSRRIREAGRQGVLPWTEFWVSTRPFGTPLGPYAVIWGLTALMIVAVPAGDAFTFGMFVLYSRPDERNPLASFDLHILNADSLSPN